MDAAPFIMYDEFAKLDLRVGIITGAGPVDKSANLLCLQVDLGEEKPRQIVAGIKKHYQPDDLIGKRIIVVANLEPRKVFGVESHGMLLAVKEEAGLEGLEPTISLSLLTVDKPVMAGGKAG